MIPDTRNEAANMASDFAVRVATAEDEALVGDLLEASYSVLMPPSYDAAAMAAALPIITRASPALLASGTFYLAVDRGGPIVGCGGWTRERPGTGETVPELGHIRHFATHPTWTGRGIGRALYTRCEDVARSAGVKRFECYASLNAEKFYRALGFDSVRRIAIPLGQGSTLPSVLMERSI